MASSAATTSLVPPTAVAGVWKRVWEQDPIGDTETADTTTLVLWTQTPQSGMYVDIRLPHDAPGRSLETAQAAGYVPRPEAIEGTGLSSIDSMNEAMIQTFAKQKSFAGVLHFSPGDTTTSGAALQQDPELAKLAAATPVESSIPLCTCFWRRDIDYQPPTGGLDIGVCASGPANPDGSIDLRETGNDGSYAELWHRLPGSDQGPFLALKLITENDLPRVGCWVRTGKYFAYAVGRPSNAEIATQVGCHGKSSEIQSSCTGKSLMEAINSIDDDDLSNRMKLLGSYVAAYGELEPATKDATLLQWNIKHSTDPGLVGCQLVDQQVGGGTSCSVLLVTDSGGNSKSSELQVGDILLQTLMGQNGNVRKWQVMEITGTSNLPSLVQ
jgi:hypothetical protein